MSRSARSCSTCLCGVMPRVNLVRVRVRVRVKVEVRVRVRVRVRVKVRVRVRVGVRVRVLAREVLLLERAHHSLDDLAVPQPAACPEHQRCLGEQEGRHAADRVGDPREGQPWPEAV